MLKGTFQLYQKGRARSSRRATLVISSNDLTDFSSELQYCYRLYHSRQCNASCSEQQVYGVPASFSLVCLAALLKK